MRSQAVLLTELSERLKAFKQQLINFQVSAEKLNHKPAPNKWSADECLKHLAVMWQTYKPQFERGIQKAKRKTKDNYRSTWFGKWFANRMKPIQQKGSMKTMNIFEPSQYASEHDSIKRLIDVQDEMIRYVELLADYDLNTKILSPASRLVRLKMGDALQIIANHQDRHWQQALRAIESSG